MSKKRRAKKRSDAPSGQASALAWMGWSLEMPQEWRPLKIEGNWGRGTVTLGDTAATVLQLAWWRPSAAAGPLRRLTRRRRPFDAPAWLDERLRRVGRAAAGGNDGPRPAGFDCCAWVPPAGGSPGGGEGSPGLWYGYSSEADLVIEAAAKPDPDGLERNSVSRRVLPSLRAAGPGEDTRVAIFGASFTAPAGFRPDVWHLHLGDIALKLRSREVTLVLRQVYPAEIALSRRTLARWLEASPFAGRRRLRPTVEPEPCTVEVAGAELSGVCRTGVKRLPRPLSWLGPLSSAAVAVHDTVIGRLLLAEYDCSGAARSGQQHRPDDAAPDDKVAEAIAGMNWAMSREESPEL